MNTSVIYPSSCMPRRRTIDPEAEKEKWLDGKQEAIVKSWAPGKLGEVITEYLDANSNRLITTNEWEEPLPKEKEHAVIGRLLTRDPWGFFDRAVGEAARGNTRNLSKLARHAAAWRSDKLLPKYEKALEHEREEMELEGAIDRAELRYAG